MPARNNIKKFTYRLYDKDEKNDGAIRVTSPTEGLTIPKGNPLWIEWIFTREGGIMKNVDIAWVISGDNDPTIIDITQPNHEYYIWNIPNDFTDYKEPDIIWQEDPSVGVYVSRNPILKIIPDLNTNEITSSSFLAYFEGYFLTSDDDASINLQLEMVDDSGQVSYTDDGDIWANIKFNKLDMANPVTVALDASIFFPGTIDYKNIDIYVSNSVNSDVFGIANNIKIV